MDLKKIISKYKDVALSDSDVLKLVDGKANIILYPELYKFKSLDEILEPYGSCFLLFEIKEHFGHWVCLNKLNNNLIEFFDPYGEFIDTQRKFIPELFRKKSHQDWPHLSYLMDISPYELSYNQYNFQKYDENIKTCGRWCSVRIILKFLDLETFKELFYGKNSDDIVTLLTI